MQECDSTLTRGNASPNGSLIMTNRRIYEQADSLDASNDFNGQELPKYSMLMNRSRHYQLHSQHIDAMSGKMASSDIYASVVNCYSPKRAAEGGQQPPIGMSPMGNKMNGSFRTYAEPESLKDGKQQAVDINYSTVNFAITNDEYNKSINIEKTLQYAASIQNAKQHPLCNNSDIISSYSSLNSTNSLMLPLGATSATLANSLAKANANNANNTSINTSFQQQQQQNQQQSNLVAGGHQSVSGDANSPKNPAVGMSRLGQMNPTIVNLISRHSASDDDDSGCALEEYVWVPPGLKADQVHQYFSSLPEDKIPYVNSIGEQYRVHQLLAQLPPSDNEARHCNHLETPMEVEHHRLFSLQRKHEALGRAVARQIPLTNVGKLLCQGCEKPVENGSIALFAQRAGPQACWHPACFSCAKCKHLLADLIYFYDATEGEMYCGRHHAELLKPRCPGCDELIFSDECTEAEGKSWHIKHFACCECGELLGGQRYFLKQSKPYCCACFERIHNNLCATCGKLIDTEEMTYEDLHWHANDDCFKCHTCNKSLLRDTTFVPKHGVIFCSYDCSMSRKSGGRPLSMTMMQHQQQQQQAEVLCSPSSRGHAYSSQAENIHTRTKTPTPSFMNNQLLSSPSTAAAVAAANGDQMSKQQAYVNQMAGDSLDPKIIDSLVHTQSRSRKPFTLAEYEGQRNYRMPAAFGGPPAAPKHLSAVESLKQYALQMDNSTNSFDDLDAVDVINLNQRQIVRSRHADGKQNAESKAADPRKMRSSLKSAAAAANQFYADEADYEPESQRHYGSQQNLSSHYEPPQLQAPQPTSILKSDKMYRPTSNNPYAFNMTTENNAGGATLPRKHRNYAMESNNFESSNNVDGGDYAVARDSGNPLVSKSSSCIGQNNAGAAPGARQTKRVQFANIPPLVNASSVGNLTISDATEFSTRSHRSRMNVTKHMGDMSLRDDYDPRYGPRGHNSGRHHSSGGHHHGHHSSRHGHRSSHGHRRSSSTSNFNAGAGGSVSASRHRSSSGRRGCQSSRNKMSNRSLNMGGAGDDQYGYEDEYNSACEFDDDNTCSTCSSSCSNITSSTSTDSESEDDFGCDPLMEFNNQQRFSKNSILRSSQMSGRSFNHPSQHPRSMYGGGGQSMHPNMSASYRAYNPGLKISYVDSLPLARTNPAPTSGADPSKSKGKSKGKTLSKFKKDNCVVS